MTRRITFVIPLMTSGGAERVMATMANYWAAAGWPVTLLTFDDGSEPSFYRLDSRIEVRPLGIAQASSGALVAVRNNITRMRTLRQAIVASRPDAVISFLETINVTTLLATRGLKLPVIVEEHTDPATKSLGPVWIRLRNALYPRASRVVVLSEQSRAYFGNSVQQRTVIIPNPIVVEPPSGHEVKRQRRTMIAMGRLSVEKGFDLLLDAFDRVAAECPEWDLEIWGDGPLREDLRSHRDRLGLSERVRLPGRTTSPHTELRAADCFVMSSRREGFPMALGEAMACGLPAVSTDCPSGPRQLIRDGVDGLLVPPDDPTALAGAMQRVMQDDDLRARLASRAPEVLDRFGIERVMSIWESMLDDVCGSAGVSSRREIRTKRRHVATPSVTQAD